MTKEEYLARIRNRKPNRIPLEELSARTGIPILPPDDPIFHLGSVIAMVPHPLPSVENTPDEQELPTTPSDDTPSSETGQDVEQCS